MSDYTHSIKIIKKQENYSIYINYLGIIYNKLFNNKSWYKYDRINKNDAWSTLTVSDISDINVYKYYFNFLFMWMFVVCNSQYYCFCLYLCFNFIHINLDAIIYASIMII